MLSRHIGYQRRQAVQEIARTALRLSGLMTGNPRPARPRQKGLISEKGSAPRHVATRRTPFILLFSVVKESIVFEIALAVLVVMTLAGSLAVAGSRVAAWATLGTALLWPFVNRPMEGPVLLVVGQGHGLTVSDLLAPAGVLLSIVVLRGRLRCEPGGSNGGDAS